MIVDQYLVNRDTEKKKRIIVGRSNVLDSRQKRQESARLGEH